MAKAAKDCISLDIAFEYEEPLPLYAAARLCSKRQASKI
jgi:hypothetical protein